jgi:hypothetical protein
MKARVSRRLSVFGIRLATFLSMPKTEFTTTSMVGVQPFKATKQTKAMPIRLAVGAYLVTLMDGVTQK